MFRKKNSHRKNNQKKSQLDQIQKGIENIQEGIENLSSEIEKDLKIVTKKIKKKIGLFYKVNFFILLMFSIVLAYFVILVSTTPKSFPFVTNKVREHLQKNFGNATRLENVYISFTRYGTLKVSIKNLKFLHEAVIGKENQEFLIPQLDAEFSLLNLVGSSFVPRKIKISDPEIVIDDWQKFYTKKSSPEQSLNINPTAVFIRFLSQMKQERFLTKSFEIENARLIIKNQQKATTILIKKSQIRSYAKNDVLYISSLNKLSFGQDKNDVEFNSSCKLDKNNALKCDLFLVNFIPDSISSLHPSIKVLEQISTSLNASLSIQFSDNKLRNIAFKAEAKKGSFTLPEFFSKKMDFSDFSLKGEYDDSLRILNFSEIKTDFQVENSATDQPFILAKSHFAMSLLISDLQNLQNNHLDFYIKLQDAPGNELEKLWPVSLSEKGIRQWVIKHIKNGMVKDAYAKFSLARNNGESVLEKIDSELNFSGIDLKYSDNFPQITNIGAKAKFSKDAMKIAISSGDVLGSKISDAQVVIDSFQAPVVMLKISGKSEGQASDSIKHADNSSAFSLKVDKYLNGNSKNDFDIRIPLQDNLALKDTYIAVNSAIDHLDNEYLRGDLSVGVKKDFGSQDFVAAANLKDAQLSIKPLNIEKNSGSEGGLNLTIAFPDTKKIALKNISLWKREKVTVKKVSQITKMTDAKISGNISAEISPFLVTEINLKNDQFGKNSYIFSYTTDKKTSSEKISLRGQVFDLSALIQNKFAGFPEGGKKFKNSNVQIALNNLLLANNKFVKDLSVALKCSDQFCYSGSLRASYNKKQQSASIQIAKKDAEKFATIDGRITDIGYLAEALGISNIISGGDARLKLQVKSLNKKQLLEGEVIINDSITIFENPTVKRLATNDLFSKVRDKIFSNDKTTFDTLKLEFAVQDSILEIKSLIANNYKIGITAKGKFDLKNDTCDIRGMIVPGFIINNLFGIGNIPILGNVISGLLTGGEGGGLFGIRYQYIKKPGDKEAVFETNKISSFVPTTIKNLFDLI